MSENIENNDEKEVKKILDEVRDYVTEVNKVNKPDKVYIVGFAPTWLETPWKDGKDGNAEIWGLNELYRAASGDNGENFTRWFEIHNPDSPSKKTEEHHAFMEACHIPLYMQKKDDRFPMSVKYPLDEVTEFFKEKGCNGAKYFTNSISYMIALAIYEGFKEIHIYGVDMAQSSEFSHQRPSCEYFIALAEGMGIKVILPQNSDLIKTGMMYGYADDNQMRIKMKERIKDLKDRKKAMHTDLNKLLGQKAQLEAGINQIQGAIDNNNFFINNWCN